MHRNKRYAKGLGRKKGGGPTDIVYRPRKKKGKALKKKKYWAQINKTSCAWRDYYVYVEDAQKVVDSKGDGYYVDNCKTCSGFHVRNHRNKGE